MMTSLLDYDPNVDGIIEHFGVKGMRWGVRRRLQKNVQESARQEEADAKMHDRIAGQIERGVKSSNIKETRRVLSRAADELDGIDDESARYLRESVKSIDSGKGIGENPKRIAKGLRSAADHNRDLAKRLKEISKKDQVKLDKLKAEMEKDKLKKEEKAAERSVSNGREFVNVFLTGNNKGRITKGVVAQYAIAGGIVGAMIIDSKRK